MVASTANLRLAVLLADLALLTLAVLATLVLLTLALLPATLIVLLAALLALVGIGLRLALAVRVLALLAIALLLVLVVLVVGIVGHDVLLVAGSRLNVFRRHEVPLQYQRQRHLTAALVPAFRGWEATVSAYA